MGSVEKMEVYTFLYFLSQEFCVFFLYKEQYFIMVCMAFRAERSISMEVLRGMPGIKTVSNLPHLFV